MRLWLLCYAVADRMWSSSAAGALLFAHLQMEETEVLNCRFQVRPFL